MIGVEGVFTNGRCKDRRAVDGLRRTWLAGLALALILGACGSSGRKVPPAPKPTAPTTVPVTSTAPGLQTSGPRTVLSPIGLHVRSKAAASAAILGTAAQGAVLTVVGRTTQNGGWFEVKGATVTGWISSNPALSASGRFSSYSSGTGAFNALYPVAWTARASSPVTTIFSAPSGGETIVVTQAATVAKIGRGPPGYQQVRSEPIVVCGVTSRLVTYASVGTPPTSVLKPGSVPAEAFASQIRLALSAHAALGIDGNLSKLGQLQDVRNFANSVTFPFPKCEG